MQKDTVSGKKRHRVWEIKTPSLGNSAQLESKKTPSLGRKDTKFGNKKTPSLGSLYEQYFKKTPLVLTAGVFYASMRG